MTDLTITQGDEKPYNLTIQMRDGQPLNLTETDILMSIKRTLSDTAPIVQVAASILDVENGLANITLTSEHTSIPVGEYFYDMEMVGLEVPRTTILKGKLKITWQVTQ